MGDGGGPTKIQGGGGMNATKLIKCHICKIKFEFKKATFRPENECNECYSKKIEDMRYAELRMKAKR